MDTHPGRIVLLGSGETSPNIRRVYDWLFTQLTREAAATGEAAAEPTSGADEIRVSILETPAGFEPNSDYVADQIRLYLQKHLQNFDPRVEIVPARRRGTAYSPDDPKIIAPLYDANVILMGPGSPTYAVRQLHESVAWDTLRACHRLGATLIFASATTLASSAHTLPVYEIYKVGEDLHWKRGLDFFRDFGLDLVFISHWNNNDGGDILDTSHCYMGTDRYRRLVDMLPAAPGGKPYTIVGIDENTALIMDPQAATCRVMGPGGVVIIRHGREKRFDNGETFAMSELGPFTLAEPERSLPADIWQRTQQGVADAARARTETPTPTPDVMSWLEERNAARERKDWAASDRLRDQIEAAGWQVMDTPEGSVLEPA